jgi:preprotein translocase subunit YajC
MYATVKEVSEDTVLLDAGPGVELLFAKNAIGAVLSDEEYNRIVHGIEHDLKSDVVPDDASSLTETDEPSDDASAASDDKPIDLGKKDAPDDAADDTAEAKADEAKAAEAEPKKTDGESDAK